MKFHYYHQAVSAIALALTSPDSDSSIVEEVREFANECCHGDEQSSLIELCNAADEVIADLI